MKLNLTTVVMAAMVAVTAVPALARDAASQAAQQVAHLKDGTAVYIFKDGKMAMEDKYGRPVRMKEGHVMETKDGQKVPMVGDEVARLDSLLSEGHRN